MTYYYRLSCLHTHRPLCSKIFKTRMDAHVYAEKINLQVALNRLPMTTDEAYVSRH